MAGKSFRCKLITPEARLLDEPVLYVNMPLWDGQSGIMPRRAPLLAKLGIGELRIDFAEKPAQDRSRPATEQQGGAPSPGGPGGGSRSYFVDGGFAQMVGDSLTLLAEQAIPVESLSEQDARAELAEAEARQPEGGADLARITRDRHRAKVKLDLAQRFRASGGAI